MERAARRERTSRRAQGVAFFEKVIRLLQRDPSKLLQIGPSFVLYKLRKAITSPVAFRIVSRRHWYFTLNDHQYRYFYHPFNETWRNERCVELPIIREEVEKVDAERVLEFGNVLAHYYPVYHDIVDKHEKGDGVINSDIVDFQTPKVYDLIVSISTIEHVGFNEEKYVQNETVLQPEKPLHVIHKLKGMLSQKGKCIVTMPVGYNPVLDRLLEEDDGTLFTYRYYLKRISRSNRWVETKKEDIHNTKYGFPFLSANVLAIYVFECQYT